MAKDIKTKEKVIEKKTKGSVGKAADRAKISTRRMHGKYQISKKESINKC